MGTMPDRIPISDRNEAYDVVPSTTWPRAWWTVTLNGIPVWHCPTRQAAERYATNPAHRASLVAEKLWEKAVDAAR
jgi:hypothetical protein